MPPIADSNPDTGMQVPSPRPARSPGPKLVGLLAALIQRTLEDRGGRDAGVWEDIRSHFMCWPDDVSKALAGAVQRFLLHLPDQRVAIQTAWWLSPLAIGPIQDKAPRAEARLGKQADAQAQIRWLRKWIKPTARDQVAWVYCGLLTRDDGWNEILLASEAKAVTEGWSRDVGLAAAQAAWADGDQTFRLFHNALRQRIWPLAKAHAPGEQMLASAREVNDRFGCLLPTVLLHDAVVRIAHGVTKKRSVRRG